MKIKKYLILTIFALLNFELNAVVKNKTISPIKECQYLLDVKNNRTWGDRYFFRTWQRTGKSKFFDCLKKQLEQEYFKAEIICLKDPENCWFGESSPVTRLIREVYFWLNKHYPIEHKQFIKEFAEHLRYLMKIKYFGSKNFQKFTDEIYKTPTDLRFKHKKELEQMENNWLNFQEAFFPYLYELYGQDELQDDLRKDLQQYIRCACKSFDGAIFLMEGYRPNVLTCADRIRKRLALAYDFELKEIEGSKNNCRDYKKYFNM
jgi:hypothetical protein